MVEMHEYSENTTNTCKTCKDIHDLHKDEEGQIEDYHLIVPNKKHNKTKKRTARDADLNDFRNKNVKLKAKPGFHASQLDAFEAYSESDNSLSASKSASDSSKSNSRKSNKSTSSKSSSRKKKRTARDADLNDFRNKKIKLITKPGFHASQLDAFEAYSESDNSRSKDSSHKGGKSKSKKNQSKKNNNKNNNKTMKQ
jgi:hypothetical protein